MRIYDDKEKRQENVLQNVSISYESRNFHYPVADAEIDEGSGSGPPPSCGDQTEFQVGEQQMRTLVSSKTTTETDQQCIWIDFIHQ